MTDHAGGFGRGFEHVQAGAGLKLITPATTVPFTLEDLRLYLRIDQEFEDDVLTRMQAAAVKLIQDMTNYSFADETWLQALDRVPHGNSEAMYLARKPVRSITQIEYTDPDGNLTIWPDNEYQLDVLSETARVAPVPGFNWPDTQFGIFGVLQVTYVSGFATVPVEFEQALLLLIAHWYRNRENVVIGKTSKDLEWTTRAILATYLGRDERVRV